MKYTYLWGSGLVVVVVSLLLVSCFPDGEGDDNVLAPSDDIVNDDSPGDIPTDIDPDANTSDAGIDSMYTLLMSRVEKMDSCEDQKDMYAIDFDGLRRGFGAAVAQDTSHVKANFGLIVASLLSLNSNDSIQMLIDSIEAYINEIDEYYSDTSASETRMPAAAKRSAKSAAPATALSSGILKNTYARSGINGVGRVLLAESPKVLLAATKRPAFPRFLTVSFIQGIIKHGVIPKLNQVLAASQRLINENDMSLIVTLNGDSAELDRGDLMLFSSGVRLTRAMLAMFCIYDYDLHSPDGSKDMRWIDDMIDIADTMENSSSIRYRLSNDTLYKTSIYDGGAISRKMAEVQAYNLTRDGFLEMKNNYFEVAYEDLKKVPTGIKNGLSAIRDETDDQNDDLLVNTDVIDMESDMASFESDMRKEGFSADLSANFASPSALMDFILELLAGPYEFNETIDSINVTIKIDLSKFFTNPAKDLKDRWPRYTLVSGDDRLQSIRDGYYSRTLSYEDSTLYHYLSDYDTVIVDIPASRIDTIERNSYSFQISLTQGYTTEVEYDSTISYVAMKYVDDQNNVIDYDKMFFMEDGEMSEEEMLKKAFPYFKDYTFGGIFPDMTTRQEWIDFFTPFVEQ